MPITSKKTVYDFNLIKNHSGEKGLKSDWNILTNPGDGWIVESPPVCVQPLPDDPIFENINHCFATSYNRCWKEQVIDLIKEGASEDLIDQLQPTVKISEWYSSRSDCPAIYENKVQLLNESNEVLKSHRFLKELKYSDQNKWFKFEYEFKNYGPGLRKISFAHGGRVWAYTRVCFGHHGCKMAGVCILLELPFYKNLAKDHSGEKGLKSDWNIVANEGDGWAVESPPVGIQKLPKDLIFENLNHCFVTSYNCCWKEQIINLAEEGASEFLMDQMQPTIKISEWYGCRQDCSAMYANMIQLLNESDEILESREFSKDLVNGDQNKWFKLEYEFKNYGPGLRKIIFGHGGQDKVCWGGHYGSKMSGACVLLELPFNKNLVKNHSGQNGLKTDWNIVANEGDGWTVESPPDGAQELPKDPIFNDINHCFTTSYNCCWKEQIINLREEGASEFLMDQIKPAIKVSEWYSSRSDCPALYANVVQLLNESDEELLSHEFFKELTNTDQNEWLKFESEFKNYGKGLRKILFGHGGQDKVGWAGHYGSKMAGACITLEIPETRNYSTKE